MMRKDDVNTNKVKEVLKRVRKLELSTKKLVDGLMAGEYRSVFKGRGIEFSEVREYVVGDDPRAIDWNVTARFGHPYVKEFIEERDLTVYIVFDLSASNDFGFKRPKKDTGTELAASIGFAALRNNDRVGLCLFTDRVEKFIPPRKGRKHLLKLLRELIYHQPVHRATDIGSALKWLSKTIKRRAILFLISDFIATDEFDPLLKLLKMKHDVILININDVRESDIPAIGYVLLEDEETGEQLLVDTNDDEFRRNYIRIAEKRNNSLAARMKKVGVDLVQLRTDDEEFETPLRRFFKLRQRRMVR